MSLNLHITSREPADNASYERRFQRWHVDFGTRLVSAEDVTSCRVFDLSPGGAGIDLPMGGTLAVGARLDFILPGYGAIPAEVRYDQDGYYGLMFLHRAEGEFDLGRHLVTVEANRQRGLFPDDEAKVAAPGEAAAIEAASDSAAADCRRQPDQSNIVPLWQPAMRSEITLAAFAAESRNQGKAETTAVSKPAEPGPPRSLKGCFHHLPKQLLRVVRLPIFSN